MTINNSHTIEIRYNTPAVIAAAIAERNRLDRAEEYVHDEDSLGSPAFIADEGSGLIGLVGVDSDDTTDALLDGTAWLEAELATIFADLYGDKGAAFEAANYPKRYAAVVTQTEGYILHLQGGPEGTPGEEGGELAYAGGGDR